MPEFIQAIIPFALFLILVILIIGNIRIVPQANAYVIERLGGYKETWQVGLKFKIPFIDRIRSKISLKEQVVDFPPQPVITKDNVSMQIDTVVYYQVTDPKLFTYGVRNPIVAIENLTATTLRNIIGQLELDESLTSRDIINTQMRSILDEATDPWGIKVNRVEVKNILPPRDIQEAMEKQMRAERERRRAILEAEGEKKAAILKAEGERESRILRAQGEKESAILAAEGEKEAAIRIAEGRSKAIVEIQKATAIGIQHVKQSAPDQAVLTLKSFDALTKVADGKSTKLIIPSELQNVASLVSAVTEVAKVATPVDKPVPPVTPAE